jgi:hypothetical protein
VVPNPYTLLFHIPSNTFYFSIFNLKDAFFTIPLHPDCHNLFAFMWKDPASGIAQQLTRTVLPQVFRDSPHFFAQALAWDLTSLDLQPSTLLQYVDDLLLCSLTLTHSQDHTALLFNFLAQTGY